MTDDRMNSVVVLLANDAMEAAQDHSATAAIMLIDAAACILVTRLNKAGAREMAGHLGSYIREQVIAATEAQRP